MLALHQAQRIHGWMSDAELLFLAHTAKKSKLIYEIGSYIGRSTRAMGDNTEGIVYAIDPWDVINFDGNEAGIVFSTDATIYNMFHCNNYDLIQAKKVIPVRSLWADWHPTELADFIFIDGDHRYEVVKKDIAKALMYLKSDGILAGHDYAHPWKGVIKTVNEYFQTVNSVDTIWWVQT